MDLEVLASALAVVDREVGGRGVAGVQAAGVDVAIQQKGAQSLVQVQTNDE